MSQSVSKAIRADMGAGIAIALLSLTYALSYGVLIFSSPTLAPFVGYGITATLVTSIITVTVVAFMSRLRFAIAGPDGSSVAVLASFTMAFADYLNRQGVDPQSIMAMTLTAMTAITLLTGAAMYLLGRFQFGSLIRFVPISVAGGFLAAAGCLMINGALQLATDSSVFELLQPTSLSGLKLGMFASVMGLAAVHFLLTNYTKSQMSLSIGIFASIFVVHILLYVFDITIAEAQELNILLNLGSEANFYLPALHINMSAQNFTAMLAHIPDMIVMIIVTAISILLITAGIELDQKIDGDLNHELKIHGYTIGISGFFGGFMGQISLSRSILNAHKKSRFPVGASMVVLSSLAVLLFGTSIVSLIPKISLAAMVLFIGFQITYRWLVEAFRLVDKYEYVLILLICFSTLYAGYILGLGLGIVAGCILFAVRASVINVVRQELSGEAYRSRIVRSRDEELYLAGLDKSIRIYALQGFLFFGTAHSFYTRIKEELEKSETPIRHIIISFKHISGIDASAEQSLQKIFIAADRSKCTMSTIELPTSEQLKIARLLNQAPVQIADQNYTTIYDAMEAIEENFLQAREFTHGGTALKNWLEERFISPIAAEAFFKTLKRHEYADSTIICQQGEPSDEIYFLDTGRIDVMSHLKFGQSFRIYSFMRHTMLGEMGFIRNEERSADLIARGHTVVFNLKRETYTQMKKNHPELVSELLRLISVTLSDRVISANRTITELQT